MRLKDRQAQITKFKAMLALQDCIKRLRSFKDAHKQRLGIVNLGIFGSVARQQNTEDSDIDIVVEMEKPTLRNLYELQSKLKDSFGCEVDLVQWRHTLRPLLKQNIQRDVIYV